MAVASKKYYCFYSNSISVEQAQISILAIFETTVSMVGTILLATLVFESWLHLAIASSIAPFLLLRTEESTKLGIRWWVAMFTWVSDKDPTNNEPIDILFFKIPAIALLSVFLRFSATFIVFLKHPLISIYAIPTNWRRIILYVDSLHPPEPVAGIENEKYHSGLKYKPFIFSEAVNEFFGDKDVEGYFYGVIYFIFVFTPALLYRFSIKSTAVVWLPLLWIAPSALPKCSLKTRLEQLNKTSFSKFIFLLSFIVIVLFLLKIAIYTNVSPLAEYWESSWLRIHLNQFIEDSSIPPWQLASVINSCIAIICYFTASHYLPVLVNENRNIVYLDYFVRFISMIRPFISMYSSVCLGYLIAFSVSEFRLPPLSDKFVPW